MSRDTPTTPLPEPMLGLRPRLGDAVARLEQRSPYASVLLSTRQGVLINVEQKEEDIRQLPLSAGMVLSCLDGGVLVERSVPGFDADRLEQAVGRLHQELSSSGGGAVDGIVAPRDFATSADSPARDLSLEDKLERCRDIQRRLARLDPRVVNARATYAEQLESSIFRSRQADMAQDVVRVRMSVMAVLAQDGQVRYDWLSKGGTGGWELLEYSDEELQKTGEGAGRLFSSERIEPGEYTVVTGPGVSGTLAHESFGHGVETDLFPKERARAFDYIGRKVGSPLVDIVDDPSLPGGYASYFFDDEGALAQPTTIVEKGIFRRGISDMLSARALNIDRTANGRRQDFTRKPYARMSNTFFGPGTTRLEDLFAQVDRLTYRYQWDGDPQGWGIQITCHYGQEIVQGKLTGRIFSPVSLSGYVPQVLDTIRGVGPLVQMDQGICGKGHKEYLPNSSGGPHLLLQVNLG
jgi:TldD protein